MDDGLFRYVPSSDDVKGPASPEPTSTIAIYPNPSSSVLKIESSNGQLSILDPLGRSYEVHRNANTLDISSLPSGVYFVSDGRSRAKFVKE